MVPPAYPDLGKLARDLFKRGYHPGIWQIETKTKTSSDIEILSTGYANHENTKVSGTLQSKYKMEDQGLTITEGWNTDKWLFGEIMQKDKLAEGLTLALGAKYLPSLNDLDGKFKLGYAQEKFNFLADMGLSSNPVLNCSVAMAQNEFVGGVGVEFDIGNAYLRGWKVALGWTNETATLHGELKSRNAMLASLFYKYSDQIDLGAEIARAAVVSRSDDENNDEAQSGGEMLVSLGMIYHLEENSLIRAKISNAVELGVGYEQKLSEGITGSISAVLDFGAFGNTKFGVGLALQC